jgi:hypothetical protein
MRDALPWQSIRIRKITQGRSQMTPLEASGLGLVPPPSTVFLFATAKA